MGLTGPGGGLASATVVLGHTEGLVVPLWLAQLSPLAGPVILVAGVAVFRYLSRWYASPGH
ncbi:hypothetical protein [Brachybacterium alimentarium]|uniref:hypothetical protein n=1 Tax=Brachybacterium alimentarium TaxID=47845 RepID=UPI003FD3E6EC